MKREHSLTFMHNGEAFRGDRDKLIGVFEGKGYAAMRAEENPHSHFQAAEHLKRSDKFK